MRLSATTYIILAILVGMMFISAAAVLLLRADPSEACQPLDPVRVVVGTTKFSIPAVLLPKLKTEEGIEIKRESEALSGRKVFSAKGTRLRQWYCADATGTPLQATGFTIDGKWIADATEHEELSFERLPFVSNIIVNEGQVVSQNNQDSLAPPFFSDSFRAECGVPSVLPKTSQREVTGTQCSVNTVNLSVDTTLRLRFWIYESPGVRTRNDPDTWPQLAQEVEELFRLMLEPEQ